MKTQKNIRFINVCGGLFAATMALAFANATAQATPIILNDGGTTRLNHYVRDTNIDFAGLSGDLFPTSLPFNQNQTVIHGSSSVTAEYHLGLDGFAIDVSGGRTGQIDSRSTIQPIIYFSVTADTPYQMTGGYSAEDPGSTAKAVILTTELSDVDTSEVLFRNHQASFNVVDESFELGDMGGSLSNELFGSPTGILLAGHRYSLLYATTIYASNSGDPATAVGSLRITFGNVPEGGPSAALILLGLAGIGLARKGLMMN